MTAQTITAMPEFDPTTTNLATTYVDGLIAGSTPTELVAVLRSTRRLLAAVLTELDRATPDGHEINPAAATAANLVVDFLRDVEDYLADGQPFISLGEIGDDADTDPWVAMREGDYLIQLTNARLAERSASQQVA